MRRLFALLSLMAVAVALLAATTALASPHQVQGTVRGARVGGTNTNPLVAGQVVSTYGEGAGLVRLHIVSSSRSTARFVVWYTRGTFRGHGSYTLSAPSGGRISFTGVLHVTGGTGKFRGATGTLTSQGSQSVSTGISVQHVTGTLNY